MPVDSEQPAPAVRTDSLDLAMIGDTGVVDQNGQVLPGSQQRVDCRGDQAQARQGSRARRRDPARQQPQRQREQQVRAEAAALASAWHEQGVPALTVAKLLDCPPRTLRHWQQQALAPCQPAQPLGRPHLHATAADRQRVLGFLQSQGPWVGMPSLTGQFAGLPGAELRELLWIFRHLWSCAHPRWRSVLHWHRAGTVWAMDFTR
jgi:hypothetical protein